MDRLARLQRAAAWTAAKHIDLLKAKAYHEDQLASIIRQEREVQEIAATLGDLLREEVGS